MLLEKKGKWVVEGQNASLCAPSGKEIVLVMILVRRRHLCVVFSYGNLINITTTLSNHFHEKKNNNK